MLKVNIAKAVTVLTLKNVALRHKVWLKSEDWFDCSLKSNQKCYVCVYLFFKRVWPACCGSTGQGLQGEWAHGHEAADLGDDRLEQLYLSADGSGLGPRSLRGSLMYSDAPHRLVDGPLEHEEELLVKGVDYGVGLWMYSCLKSMMFFMVGHEGLVVS